MSLSISLTGFGCYREQRIFDLEVERGFILINAPSGLGKTTILEGIAFALYGKPSKPSRNEDGEAIKKCEVVLSYDSWIITRTYGRDKILLQIGDPDSKEYKEYQGAVAQGLINRKYGCEFEITSYITQDSSKTFSSLGPAERMAFLEKIAIGDV